MVNPVTRFEFEAAAVYDFVTAAEAVPPTGVNEISTVDAATFVTKLNVPFTFTAEATSPPVETTRPSLTVIVVAAPVNAAAPVSVIPGINVLFVPAAVIVPVTAVDADPEVGVNVAVRVPAPFDVIE